MKKLLLSLMAVAAMASCVKEQTLQTPEKMAISFSEFVNNSNTKAAIDPTFNNGDTSLNAFYVWGFMTSNTGVVFDKELVSRADAQSPWTYDNLAYWAPGRSYKFAALAPVNNDKLQVTLAQDNKYISNEGHLGTLAYQNVDGTVDVLYAEDGVITPDPLAANPEKVELTFKHLLSKIKFTFTNGLVNENNKMVVSDVKMVVPAKGTIDLGVSPFTWVVTDNSTITLDFGKAIDKADDTNDQLAVAGVGEVENERLTIPIATTSSIISSYQVSFNVTLYNGNQVAQTIPMTSTIQGTSFLPGKCYNLTATLTAENLGLKVIEFTATVEDWVSGGDLGFLN